MRKESWKRNIALLCVSIMTVGMLTACNNKSSENEKNPTTAVTEGAGGKTLSGVITMSGSTSMEKMANALAEDFMDKNNKVMVTAEFVGSSAGVEAVLKGTVDIGNASRNLKDSEISDGAVENIIAIDGIAVIVDKNNSVTDLTKNQLIAIYKGEIRNWSELSGENNPIVVVGREAGSGTRGAFEEILGIADLCQYANEYDNTGAVLAKVASTKGAIGYVSLDVLDDSVIGVSLEGVAVTAENIKAGEYFLNRPFVMATKGKILEQNELVQAFFEYLSSEDGKKIITQVGLILPNE